MIILVVLLRRVVDNHFVSRRETEDCTKGTEREGLGDRQHKDNHSEDYPKRVSTEESPMGLSNMEDTDIRGPSMSDTQT